MSKRSSEFLSIDGNGSENPWSPADNEDLESNTDKQVILSSEMDLAEVGAPTVADEFELAYLMGETAIDDDELTAADEQLTIVDEPEIGGGYGLDEEELAQLTGKPSAPEPKPSRPKTKPQSNDQSNKRLR